ncbi:cellulose biosynthesis protein BcsP [Bordetella sp. N]|uniref:cellulose biosynthesis protein BcsP n=1 Tax=Bordetella sp. N TaxID=1746199 RepID=UPI00070CEA44|nr:cellulose biosynthesis protein BcsP [Bordetella sp. N]ALM85422.1 hypothetical protein ASB57_22805 [Bordetella sp. N]
MKRETSDISSLYRQFGGDPGQYRELGRDGKAVQARERWPLLGHVQPGTRYVPPKAGSSTADRPVVAATWPPLAITPTMSLLFPEQPSADPVQRGSVASAEAILTLIHSARVERPALDALVVPPVIDEDATANEDPVGDVEFAPAVPAATPEATVPVASVSLADAPEPVAQRAEPRLEPHLAPPAAAPEQAATPAPAAPVQPAPPLTLVHPAPAARTAQPEAPSTSLQSVFKRLVQAPSSEANAKQDSPPRKTTKK